MSSSRIQHPSSSIVAIRDVIGDDRKRRELGRRGVVNDHPHREINNILAIATITITLRPTFTLIDLAASPIPFALATSLITIALAASFTSIIHLDLNVRFRLDHNPSSKKRTAQRRPNGSLSNCWPPVLLTLTTIDGKSGGRRLQTSSTNSSHPCGMTSGRACCKAGND